MAAVLFCGCDKEENGGNPTCPVTEVELPASSEENPVSSGSSVTIQGTGFTANSEIWLRPVTRAADVQAEVTDVTATAITFTAPQVSGEQNIVLKQDGGEWTLGKMYFATSSQRIASVKLQHFDLDDENYTTTIEYTYDSEGRIIKTTMTDIYPSDNDVLTMTYTYGENRIDIKREGWFPATGYIELQDGHASKYVLEEIDGGEKFQREFFLSYDDNGYLTSYTLDNDGENCVGTITIAEGSWKRYLCEAKTSGGTEIEFTMSEHENNLNIDLMGLPEWLGEDTDLETLCGLNVVGVRSKYLPSSVHTKLTDYNEEIFENDYEFTYHSNNGVVTGIDVMKEGTKTMSIEITLE